MDEKMVVGRGIVRNDSIRSYIGDRRHVILVDKVVQSRYSALFEGLHTISVHAGEMSKTLDVYADVIRQMTDLRLTRRDVVVAVGGGTITDLAGFVASTYKRGIGLINIPTTLLGMCDAAIGGKNALNTESTKNVIGTFYRPELVLVDPSFLESLDYSTLLNGMGEMFKYAVGFDRSMLPMLKRLAPVLAQRASFQGEWDRESTENILLLVKRATCIKLEIVQDDFSEMGKRKTLNLGHTLAHAIESSSDYRISHGEAVAMGTLMIVAWAHRMEGLTSDEFGEVQECYRSLAFPRFRSVKLDWDKVFTQFGTDKKMVDLSRIDAIVLERLGSAVIQRLPVAEFTSEMMKSLSDLLSHEIAREVSPLTMDVKEYLADFKNLLDQREQRTVHSNKNPIRIDVPGSKSYAHRYLILAAYAKNPTEIRGITLSDDIQATISALRAMTNATFEVVSQGRMSDSVLAESERPLRGAASTIRITPSSVDESIANHIVINCRESASTARFLVPFSGIAQKRLGRNPEEVSTYFRGAGSLQRRPMGEILHVLRAQGILEAESDKLPFTVKGWLRSGLFRLSGEVSSQFLSGLLMATPLLGEQSAIEVAGAQVSEPYVSMTIHAMKKMGVSVEKESGSNGGIVYHVLPALYSAGSTVIEVEKDFSQASFWLVAEILRREYEIKGIRTGLPEIYVPDLDSASLQSDRLILKILGVALGENGQVMSVAEPMTMVDLSDAPDLLPIVATYYAVGGHAGKITGAERNRIKESDRIAAMVSELTALGFKLSETADGIEIWPSGVQGRNRTVQSHGDHRIAMSLGITSLFVPDVAIEGKEAINKSYPAFFAQLEELRSNRESIEI